MEEIKGVGKKSRGKEPDTHTHTHRVLLGESDIKRRWKMVTLLRFTITAVSKMEQLWEAENLKITGQKGGGSAPGHSCGLPHSHKPLFVLPSGPLLSLPQD